MNFLFKVFSFFALALSGIEANQEEAQLRTMLFSTYNPKVRPVENITSTLTVQMGLALQNIERVYKRVGIGEI